MLVEPIKTGFLFAPDVRVTRLDGKTSTLVGGYAGALTDSSFFIGGGAYWLANGNRDRELAYGGVVVGWLAHTDRPIGFGVKTLVGAGQATLATTVTTIAPGGIDFDQSGFPKGINPALRTITIRDRPGFFVAEPEANLFVNLSKNVRIAAGAGYRLVGADRNEDHRLRGASGSLSLQIGGS